MDTCYKCEGSCDGMVTEEEYAAGKTTCGAKNCTNFGKALKMSAQCENCSDKTKQDGNANVCVNCG